MPKLSDEAIESRKAHIIESAFKVFSEKGYSHTSIDDIARHAGTSKGGIYNYYKSKEEIFLEIAASRLISRRALLDEIPKADGIKIFLEAYFKAVLGSLREERHLMTAKFSFEFWATVARDPRLNAEAKRRYEHFKDDLLRILELGIKRGEFEPMDDIDGVAYVILSTLDGMIHTHAIMGIELTDKSIEAYVNMIMTQISGRN